MMVCAILFSLAFTVVGLWISYEFNLTSGATVIMVGAAAFCLSGLIDWVRHALRSATPSYSTIQGHGD
jgi:zinc transport system permease protein